MAKQREGILLKGVNDLNELQIFSYQSHEVRTVEMNCEPWFVLKDVCDVLGLSTPARVAERLDSDEVSQAHLIDSVGRSQEMTIISESGLYNVILRSDKPEAKPFRKWVTSEVLPQIRKTGAYMAPADPNLPPELAMVEGLLNSMKQMYSTQQRHDKAIEQLTESMDTMKEVMTTDVNGDWRTACGHAIQAVARKQGGGKAYEEAWNEVYTEMERNGFFVRRRLENRKKSAAAQGMSPTYVRKLNALDIIADSKDKKLMSAFINATKKLAAAHSVRMDRLNELPAVEEQPEQTAFDRTCAPAGKLIDTLEAAVRD